MTGPEVSHGRGGAGNINPDDTIYVDGEIVRQGEEGSHGDGAANIGDAGKPGSGARADQDLVPEAAMRPSQERDAHVGRGGAANVALASSEDHKPSSSNKVTDSGTAGASAELGLADKLKQKILGVFKK
ncbi:hypothetical protein F4779DRAFT_622697 [Xylariaceae sp. FL0662B]|nr:hypothetical protein F4779DRAFT_622697 [Xylariaceae sp. FL0662B]